MNRLRIFLLVGREGEWNAQRLGVLQGLLDAIANTVMVVLRLDQRDGDVWLIIKNVVCATALASRDELATHDDASLSEEHLFTKLHDFIPASLPERWRDEFGADVALGKRFLVYRWQQSLPAQASQY
jgi:hypothetical protein